VGASITALSPRGRQTVSSTEGGLVSTVIAVRVWQTGSPAGAL